MTYYKIFDDRKFYGVGTTNELRRYQAKHKLLLTSNENNAQFIAVGEGLYRDEWMKDASGCNVGFMECSVKAITEDEYCILKSAKDEDEAVKLAIGEKEPVNVEEEEEPELEITAEELREMKIRQMSLACSQSITDGFGIELKDGQLHHFSLTMADQMNLLTIQSQILAGATEVPYHADGEDGDMFSAEDMANIIAAANTHKTYHLAYFNAMKKWLNALKSIAAISAVKYGTEIPKKYQTALLKRLAPQ